MVRTNFTKLTVWNKSHKFVLSIYSLTMQFPQHEIYGLTSQIRRSASSVAMNIVEGNEKRTTREYKQFLYIAKSSLAETQYQLLLARDLQYISEIQFNNFNLQASDIGKMINGLIKYLQNRE